MLQHSINNFGVTSPRNNVYPYFSLLKHSKGSKHLLSKRQSKKRFHYIQFEYLKSKMRRFFNIILFEMIRADLIKNNQYKQSEIYEEKLKAEFGCSPSSEWDLVKNNLKGSFVRNVCLSKNYQIEEPPSIGNLTPVHMHFSDLKILEADEKKKSIELLMKLWFFWEDARIKISDPKKSIRLPYISKTQQGIWYPFATMEIQNMKELAYSHDPVVVKHVWFGSSNFSNYFFTKPVFASSTNVVSANMKLKVKISCHFNFSSYPFDRQKCFFKLYAENLDITIYEKINQNISWIQTNQNELIGFDVNMTSFCNPPVDFGNQYNNDFTKISEFGIIIVMERQFTPYLYQYYIPCFAIVFTSFFSFIVPLSAIPGRVALVVTQFLTLTNVFTHEMVNINRL